MSYRLLATTCKDGDCPSFLADDTTGDVIMRSRDAQDPTRELDIRYTASEFDSLLRQIGR